MTAASAESPRVIAAVIVGVLALSALLAWGTWRVCKTAERAELDPRFLRKILLGLGLLYVISAALALGKVIAGKEPVQSLVGLPIGAALAWLFLRAAVRVKLPPS